MGDIADWLIDRMMDGEYHSGYVDDPEDYDGPFTPNRHYGNGPCPRCGSETHLANGPYGAFYGCNNYPKCKGMRYINKKSAEAR